MSADMRPPKRVGGPRQVSTNQTVSQCKVCKEAIQVSQWRVWAKGTVIRVTAENMVVDPTTNQVVEQDGTMEMVQVYGLVHKKPCFDRWKTDNPTEELGLMQVGEPSIGGSVQQARNFNGNTYN